MKKVNYFIILFILSFCYSFFISCVYNDEIWNYGFAYNIASGLIPYRDFNMVITPLYSMMAAIFIKLFGHHLYLIHIFNSLVLSFMMIFIYHKLGKKSILLFPFILLNGYPGYNILSVFIVVLLLIIDDFNFKYKDIVLGFLVGLLFLTKQTVGITVFIPMFFYSKNRLKSFISFLIPICVFFIYLLWNKAFYHFINYCFLGLFDFGNSNSIYFFLPLEIIICVLLVYYLIKSRFTDVKLFYLLMFQVITIPIFDDYHFMIGIIPILYYVLLKVKILNYKIKYYFIISLFFCCSWNFYIHSYELGHLYSDKTSYLYGRNIPLYIENIVTELSDYIGNIRGDYDHVYMFSSNAYYIKLNALYKLDKYDLICNGNMGYNGSQMYVDEIDDYCDNHQCMFILYRYEFRKNRISQTNKTLVKYVKENYNYYQELDVFDIYVN